MIKCNHCDREVEPITEKVGVHLKASCPICKKYIKFISQGLPPMLYFGKYKGKTIQEVASLDVSYLKWLYGETKNAKLKEKIGNVIYQ